MPTSDGLSRLRQSLRQLGDETARLLEIFLQREPLLRGSVYELRRKCGKAACCCATAGQLHATPVLSRSEGGRTRLLVVPEGKLAQWRELTRRYQELRQARARLVKIHAKMVALIDQLERARQTEP
jgi:hypothetical protein